MKTVSWAEMQFLVKSSSDIFLTYCFCSHRPHLSWLESTKSLFFLSPVACYQWRQVKHRASQGGGADILRPKQSFFFFFWFLFQDRVLLHCSGYLGTQNSLCSSSWPWTQRYLPASASPVLGLKARATTLSQSFKDSEAIKLQMKI